MYCSFLLYGMIVLLARSANADKIPLRSNQPQLRNYSIFPASRVCGRKFFCLLSFQGCIHSIWRFLRQGSNLGSCCQPTPEPQQCQIRATSATYTTAHGNAGSLTFVCVCGSTFKTYPVIPLINQQRNMEAELQLEFVILQPLSWGTSSCLGSWPRSYVRQVCR